MEQRRTAGRTERQIAGLVKYHEVGTHRPVCVLPLFAGYLVPFQRVDALGATSPVASLSTWRSLRTPIPFRTWLAVCSVP